MTKPCLILYSSLYDRYEAYNEDGRRICHHANYDDCQIKASLYGYHPTDVPHNSRLGKTILDKIDERKTL